MRTKIIRVADQVSVPAEIKKFSQKNLDDFETLPRAEEFYRKINMIDCGQDEEKDGLTYFEWYKIGGSP